jgi:hypothetical protein
MMAFDLLSPLNEHGYEGRVVSIDHVDELHEEIEGPHGQGRMIISFFAELAE